MEEVVGVGEDSGFSCLEFSHVSRSFCLCLSSCLCVSFFLSLSLFCQMQMRMRIPFPFTLYPPLPFSIVLVFVCLSVYLSACPSLGDLEHKKIGIRVRLCGR